MRPQNIISNADYGVCQDCQNQRTAVAYCKNCDTAYLKENFHNWTSGDSRIDEFIRFTQLNAKESMDYLEWIDFDQFELIENIKKRGAFSSIYSAVWMEGPRWILDEEAEMWTRNGPIKVILKRVGFRQCPIDIIGHWTSNWTIGHISESNWMYKCPNEQMPNSGLLE
ncbi:hypothetical protein RclHR1_05240011 [Rhizophagus clarus]|uniref:Uncharacterized protein n=1 Tax=Rhizophagus clarus TaxID=94130 RepID=A0A2Z6S4P8_9GLOM|nr:hypothetical protein RclHR1_05240011 [Rhizophagus clarus]